MPLPLALLAAAVVASPTPAPHALAATADRYPGVYEFQPLPMGACAPQTAQDNDFPTPRLSNLADLPPAYLIRLSDERITVTQRGPRVFILTRRLAPNICPRIWRIE
ncbi:MAG: hypothetical protein ACHP84_06440 [Caulobacterales bacterium]